jgi:vesicle transport through interaction with t-SNAREs protein 1
MSSDILRNYEQQFGTLCAEITNKISRSVNSTDKKAAITSIDALFQEARELLEQMELEIRDVTQKRTPEQKEKHLNITNSYKSELDKLELEFNRQVKTKRSTQTAQFDIELNDQEAKQQSTELNQLDEENQYTLHKMNKNLDNGYRMVLESEETGKNILSDLFSQRETVERARDRLRDANTNLGKSSRVVGEMARRILQNKIILFAMCALIFLAVVFTLYILIRK